MRLFLRSAGSSGRTDRRSHPHPYRAARLRLVAVNVLVVAGILALMAVAIYAWEVHATDQQVNDQLYEHAAHGLVESTNGDFGLSASATGATNGYEAGDPVAEQYEPSSPDVFTVVVNRQGVVTYDPGNVRALGLPDAAALLPVLAGRQASTLVTLGGDRQAYRLYSTPIREHGQVIGALQVGMSLAARHRQLQDLLLILATVGGAMLLITAAASFYLAGRALHPMRVAYERQRWFAAAASHELRTPLAIVRSEAELVARGLQRLLSPPSASRRVVSVLVESRMGGAADAGAPRDEQPSDSAGTHALAARLVADMREIVAEVDYMARLVDDLLLLARDEAAADRFPRREVDLVAVAGEAVAKLVPLAQANGLTLRTHQDANDSADEGSSAVPASLVVCGDRDRLKQLVLVLVDNAIRYTPTGGAIEVTVERARARHRVPHHLLTHDEVAVLKVCDSGVGIAREDLPHLFEPFYRAKAARTGGVAERGTIQAEQQQGAGLGLAVARWIVQAHGGTISATSELGQGATFMATFPLA